MSGKAVARESDHHQSGALVNLLQHIPGQLDIIAVAQHIILSSLLPPSVPVIHPQGRRHRQNTCFGFDTYPTDHAAADDHRRSQRPPSTVLHHRRTFIAHIRPLSHKRPRSHPGRLRYFRCCWLYWPGQRPRGTVNPSPIQCWMKSNRQDPLLGLWRRCGPYQVA